MLTLMEHRPDRRVSAVLAVELGDLLDALLQLLIVRSASHNFVESLTYTERGVL